MSIEIKETPFFVCPNGCKGSSFYQHGTLVTTRIFSENGEVMEDKGDYGFTPKSEMKCSGCHAVAIKKSKKITTVIE
jgi:hypothetical protein